MAETVAGADGGTDRGNGKPKCGGPRKHGAGPCTRPAGWATPHPGRGRCKFHGGSTPSHVKAAETEAAREAVVTYGLPREIDPRDALLEEVYRTAGAVDFLAGKVREVNADDLVWGRTEEVDTQATEFPGTNTKRQSVPNVWLVLYQQERKHLVDVCKAALAAGVEERKVRVAEQMGGQLAEFVRFLLDGLSLTPGQWSLVGPRMALAAATLGLVAA